MHRIGFFGCTVCLLVTLAAHAQKAPTATGGERTAGPAKNTTDFKDEGAVFEHYDTTVRMRTDGTGERNDHVVLRVQSEGAVRGFGVLAIAYASATSTAKIESVTVHKPDGTTVATPTVDTMEVTAPVTREAPMYSDLRQLQLPVRSLAAGDTLEYDLHTIFTKAEAPGQFWGAERILPFPGVMLSRTFTLEVPSGKYVQVWSPKHPPQKGEANGLTTYRWSATQLIPTAKANNADDSANTAAKDLDEDAEGRKLPSIAWTTFHNWAEVGDWYRGLAHDRTEPDAALRDRASALTANAKTPEEQVQALYSFVAARVRYVGIDLGVGRFQPHPAAEVLNNAYGDCKDKDTLLEALLRAKGFTVAPVLIGAGVTPVPDVPSPAVFNHVITSVQLPSGRVWLDSTAEVAPFGYLMPQIRDQEALIVPDKGDASLVKTPAAPPYGFIARFEATGDLGTDYILHAKMNGTYRDDEEIMLRVLARNVAPAEWDKASQYVSNLTGFSGTTSNTRFLAANDLQTPIQMSYDYTRKDYGSTDSHQVVPLFPVVSVAGNADATKEPEQDVQLGVPRKEIAVSRVRVPAGWHVDLPDAIHEKSTWMQFDKTYRFTDGEIVAERTLTVLQPKVPHADWKQFQAFSKKAELGNERWITLLPSKSGEGAGTASGVTAKKDANGNETRTVVMSAATPVPDAPPDASIADLKSTAYKQLTAGQPGAARATLDRIRAQNPKEPQLQGYYGMLAEKNGQDDEAISDYRKELQEHTFNPQLVLSIARLQQKQGRSGESRETLQSAFQAHPDDLTLGSALASDQTRTEQYAAAAATIQTMEQQHPDIIGVKVLLGNALLSAGRKDEAAAVAKAALEGSIDPGVLNDAGYLLAETGSDLAEAEEVSRRSITAIEEKSRAVEPDAVNSRAFFESNLLIAGWDTLGWILFKEGKLDQAEPYLVASWRNAYHPEVGQHLGKLLEQRGDLRGAAAQYRDAEAMMEANNVTPAVKKAIQADVARIGGDKSGLTGEARRTALQGQRTYHLPRPEGVKGWGTVRVQLTSTGVQAVEQSSGDPSLKPVLPAVRSARFSGLVPVGSKAYLLRSGVLSCSQPKECELVLVPNASLQTEQQ